MKKYSLFIIFLFAISNIYSQSNLLWKGYFSYNDIKDISETSTKVVVAAENALFSRELTTGETRTFNTIDGLSGETISTIYFSQQFNKTIIGYQTGLVVVVNENDKSIFKAVGIIQKQIPTSVKQINSFYENNGVLYISCGFGIVQFKLQNNEFGDTYFLSPTLNDYQEVVQTTVLNNSIYAVTRNNGIKKGDLSNNSLIDFSQWQNFDLGFWNGIATINSQIVASSTNNNLYKFNGVSFDIFSSVTSAVVDFKVVNNNLIVTDVNNVKIFNNQFLNIGEVNNTTINTVKPPQFSCASFINSTIYIGTKENGLLSTTMTNATIFNSISPNGPLRNVIFGMNATANKLWVCYGGYNDDDYNPFEFNADGLTNYGISKYDQNGWSTIPYSSLLGAKSISKITTNPNNPSEIYCSSFASGLLKLVNEVPTTLYNTSNSPLEIGGLLVRVNGAAFDKSGKLWINNGRVKKAFRALKTDNSWESVSIESLNPTDFVLCDYGNMLIDKNNTKWMGSYNSGVIGYNENGNVLKKITVGQEGNLPDKNARAIAIDNKNQLWIGTTNGLRIVSSIDKFLEPGQINATNIVIEEDGIGQELLFEQYIRDIVVDGSNRKWIATKDFGVFLLSPNGQKTIYNFKSDNSPLPSNSVYDIDIDPKTGEVFMATNKGMVSFKGVSTKGNENLDNVYVYPNPVRPDFNDTVKVSGLLDKSTVKITDIEGSLVFETTSEGGTVEWDTTAFGQYRVATGVYMVFVSSQDGQETKVNKVMIVR